MKTILLILATILPLAARDATFAWDANPAADAVTFYRLEIQNPAGAWVTAGTVTGQGSAPATELRVPEFPNESTPVRVIAGNQWGESDPSDILIIGPSPGKVKGLKFTLTPKVASVEVSEPGKAIRVEQSTDLVAWREIGRGWSHVILSVPRDLPRSFYRAVIS